MVVTQQMYYLCVGFTIAAAYAIVALIDRCSTSSFGRYRARPGNEERAIGIPFTLGKLWVNGAITASNMIRSTIFELPTEDNDRSDFLEMLMRICCFVDSMCPSFTGNMDIARSKLEPFVNHIHEYVIQMRNGSTDDTARHLIYEDANELAFLWGIDQMAFVDYVDALYEYASALVLGEYKFDRTDALICASEHIARKMTGFVIDNVPIFPLLE